MTEPANSEGVPDLIGRLADDAKDYIKAETVFARALIKERSRDARASLLLGVFAISILNAVLVTTSIGLVLWLDRQYGLGRAVTMIVVPGIFAIIILGTLSFYKAKRVKRPIDLGTSR